ncbi:hypothetical protein NDU88_004823 [Pleurodeles waltl]|uniref:Uncharacterized protein n=1 Tax=Pleurodeles waltl TaxID=8319 RepID=A0AAV7PGA0_PLEWA|nr:hypothetical protein NDU88_004823 [Pleurodeles waltl]
MRRRVGPMGCRSGERLQALQWAQCKYARHDGVWGAAVVRRRELRCPLPQMEPDEVWAWLGAYRRGPIDIKQVEHRQPRRRGKRRHAKDSQKDRQVTKPTRQQARQGKRAALQTAASLTKARSSEDGQRSEPESLNGKDSTDIESMTSVTEGHPRVTPQTSVDIMSSGGPRAPSLVASQQLSGGPLGALMDQLCALCSPPHHPLEDPAG